MTTRLSPPITKTYPTTQSIIDRASAELVEELLDSVRTNGRTLWFSRVERKMKRLVNDLEREKVISLLR